MEQAAFESPVWFTGWGRTPQALSAQASVTSIGDLRELLDLEFARSGGVRGLIARGLGRSYGDQAVNSGGRVALMSGEDPSSTLMSIALDDRTGSVVCGGGVTLHDLINFLVPRGWFVPVTPGTRYVTVGGAIANDIHGKNHHRGGSFGEYVEDIDLLLASGELVNCSRTANRELFLATVGGSGLTGAICRVKFRLKQIETSMMRVESERANDLDDLMEKLVASESDNEYTVAWIDLLATGKSLGRGIILAGNHADRREVPESVNLRYQAKQRLVAPSAPSGLLNKLSIRVFNEVWFRKAPRKKTISLETIPKFFHPLDGVRDWNKLYGSRGFIQYQFVVPESSSEVIAHVVAKFSQAGVASFLAVLKRFGPSSEAFLSFPRPGWTLALDIPATPRLQGFLDELDKEIVAAGGRHYLAKDSHMRRAIFEAGYEHLPLWKSVKAEVDPNGLWASDQGRRLGLC